MPRGKYERTEKIKEKITGKKNPNFKKGLYCKNRKLKKDVEKEKLNLKEEVFERDRFICQMCVRKFNPQDLVLYYCTDKGMPTKNPDNILTVCRNCERLIDEGSNWRDKDGKQIRYRWKKEDILNFRICQMQTKTVYPIGKSPNKSWYAVVYGGKKRVEVNPSYKKRSYEDIIKSVVDFSKEELKEAMIRVLKERGQSPEEWNFEEWFNRNVSQAKQLNNELKELLKQKNIKNNKVYEMNLMEV